MDQEAVQRSDRLVVQRCSDRRKISGSAQGQEVEESVAELRTQAGAVAVLEEILGLFAVFESLRQSLPDLGELVLVSVAIAVSGDGQSSGGFNADFEVLAGRDDGRESGVRLGRPAGSTWGKRQI